jgi:hypothetical protein
MAGVSAFLGPMQQPLTTTDSRPAREYSAGIKKAAPLSPAQRRQQLDRRFALGRDDQGAGGEGAA